MLAHAFRLFAALLLLSTMAPAAQADVIIRLKDGKTIALPLTPDDIESISFTTGKAARPQLPPAPKPLTGVLMRGGKRVLAVGPTRNLKLPSEAAKVAENGDIIEIDAGSYRGDVAVWRQNNLTIRGVGDRPHIDASGNNAEGKALWVVKGADTRIENIEFSGARVADENGAGLRFEGVNLTVDHCYFHDNQMGILTGSNPASDIVIRNSEFARNWLGTGSRRIGHNIYIGGVRSFTLTNSYVHDARIGHNVKSRAARNSILNNRIEDGKTGSASYLLDLPSGGVAIIKGNSFHKGSKAENPASISYGAENNLYGKNDLTVSGNKFVNDYWTGIFVDNRDPVDAKITGNKFKGPGVILRGRGAASDNQAEK